MPVRGRCVWLLILVVLRCCCTVFPGRGLAWRWRQIDEYGRMVYEGQPEKPPPIKDEDRAPFWEGLGDKISDKINEFDKEEVGYKFR